MAPDIPVVICEPCRILCCHCKYINTMTDTFSFSAPSSIPHVAPPGPTRPGQLARATEPAPDSEAHTRRLFADTRFRFDLNELSHFDLEAVGGNGRPIKKSRRIFVSAGAKIWRNHD